MAKLREPDPLPDEAIQYKERIAKGSAQYPAGQCKKCGGRHFQKHEKRARWFLAVVCAIVYAIRSVLWRWRCVNCGTTFTHYSQLCLPGKRYLRPEIQARADRYLQEAASSYRHVVRDGAAAVAYAGPVPEAQASETEKEQEDTRRLAPSTVHRWIGAIAALRRSFQPAVQQAQELGGRFSFSKLLIPCWKYRTQARKKVLEACATVLLALKHLAVKNTPELATLASGP